MAPARRETSQLLLGRSAVSPLILHPLDAHAFAPAPREEVDTDREADPCDTRTDEKCRDPDHGFHCPPPTRFARPTLPSRCPPRRSATGRRDCWIAPESRDGLWVCRHSSFPGDAASVAVHEHSSRWGKRDLPSRPGLGQALRPFSGAPVGASRPSPVDWRPRSHPASHDRTLFRRAREEPAAAASRERRRSSQARRPFLTR